MSSKSVLLRAHLATVALALHGCHDGRAERSSFDAGGSGSGGAGGQITDGGTDGAAGAFVPGPDLNGRWAMFPFEDPVAVDLQESVGVITGMGCCGGLGGDSLDCCGALFGEATGRRARFGFTFNFGQQATYLTDVFVSADGLRMTGAFMGITLVDMPVTWVRIGSDDHWLPAPDPAVTATLTPLSGRYGLVLSDAPAGGTDFLTQHTYRLTVDARFVYGDLGAFLQRELSWNAADQTLVVGPVPETAPTTPVALSLRYDGTKLTSVEAAMASGARYQFDATPVRP